MDWFAVVLTAVWAMLPAYVPNNAAVLGGGGRPVDGGRTLDDGRRVLGDGKTWRGTVVGVAAGVLAAVVLNVAASTVGAAVGVDLPLFPPLVAVSLPLGGMLGDLLASFLKRRTGRERGAAFPLVDQLDFVVVALLLAAVVAPGWFAATFTLPVLFVVLVLTPLLHVGTNAAAYWLGLKAEPY